MKQVKPKYPINQCALYKCNTKRKLESLLTIEPGGLKNIQYAIQYRSFEIDKKNTNEKRKITAPAKTIKAVQTRILTLLQRIERPEWLISGERGKCYIDNGKAHMDASYMLAVDIKKFYDNCRRDGVYRFFRNRMKTEPDVAKILTDIVTYNGGIPTGCPTSQLIAYYAYEDMFIEINKCAECYGCRFTLYVDDMTFSSVTPFPAEKLTQEIDVILRRYGHKPKYRKVKYYSKNEAKPITGTIVTSDHRLDVPNQLQKKVYDNFQLAKKLNEQQDSVETIKVTQALMGQIQAAKNLDPKRFPEIKRVTCQIQSEHSISKRQKRNRRISRQAKIKIVKPK